MLKVVIDTNVFVSSFFGGNPKKIIDLWKKGKIIIGLSQPIVEEYIFVLKKFGQKNEENLKELLKLFKYTYNSLFIANPPCLNIKIEDEDDKKFIECAVALDCEYIISGDKHLLNLKKYYNIQILSPAEFLKKAEW